VSAPRNSRTGNGEVKRTARLIHAAIGQIARHPVIEHEGNIDGAGALRLRRLNGHHELLKLDRFALERRRGKIREIVRDHFHGAVGRHLLG
jgi:hypothetical protein